MALPDAQGAVTAQEADSFLIQLSSNMYIPMLPRPEHPRPQFERDSWINLNGEWSYTFDFGGSGRDAGRELFKSKGFFGRIVVPFCPESELSGVGHKDFISDMWYHRRIAIPADWAGMRAILHFGAVDYESEVYIDGVSVGVHFGGSSSFEYDITPYAAAGTEHDLVVRVHDDTRHSDQPAGKQCQEFKSRRCSYTRTTGIWQTVWLEAAAMEGLKSCQIVPDFDGSRFVVTPKFHAVKTGLRFRATLLDGDSVAAVAEAPALDGVPAVVGIPDPKPWSPESPFLYGLRLEVVGADGTVVDSVRSYAGLRKVHIEGDRFFLNNKPLYLRFVLDQGFYPDGIWTAPSDEALKRDIELSMAAGFNGARLHQKVFEERFHYWADRLGYLTWGESSSWGCNPKNTLAVRNFLPEWAEIVERDRNHPSIIAWTPWNETWYVTVGEELRQQNRAQIDSYNLCKVIDPTRPVNDASGHIHALTDLWTVHSYARAADLEKQMAEGGEKGVWTRERFKGMHCPYRGQPYILDEFGGLKWIPDGLHAFADNTWGYGNDIPDLETFYGILSDEVDAILKVPNMCGWCYTQLTDVEQEQNGVYCYDRSVKFDMARIRRIFTREPR